MHQLSQAGYGQTSAVGIGGDPVNGTNFIDVLKAFNEDPETEAVVMIVNWRYCRGRSCRVGYKYDKTRSRLHWRCNSPGKRMGHAGAIISGGKGTAEEKSVL